jgi:polysaccharide pyruvyl transferase WcaK-like protein
MGRFADATNRAVARRLLARLVVIVARGEVTRSAVQRLLPDREVLAAPDLAFSIDASDSLVRRSTLLEVELETWLAGGSGLILGVCPSSVLAREGHASSSYPDTIRDIIHAAIASGHRIVVFPTATRSGSSGTHNNDLPLMGQLRQMLADEAQGQVLWADGVRSYADVGLIVGACDALVTSRFHAMVAGLSAGVPSLVIGWSHKYREVLADFGLDHLSFSLEDFDAERIEERLAQFLAELADASQCIADALPEVRRAAAAQLDVLEVRY